MFVVSKTQVCGCQVVHPQAVCRDQQSRRKHIIFQRPVEECPAEDGMFLGEVFTGLVCWVQSKQLMANAATWPIKEV